MIDARRKTWECLLAVVKPYSPHKHITTTKVLRVKRDKLSCSRQNSRKRDTHRGFYGSYILSVMERALAGLHICVPVVWMEGDEFEGCVVCAE